jgi:SprT protein
MNITELKAKCVDKINQVYAQAQEHYSTSFPLPTIEFSEQLTSTAGKAYFGRNHIKLSTKLLKLNGEAFVNDTPGHEAAHLISFKLYGRQGTGHGARWSSVMRAIGQTPTRCHSLITPEKTNTVSASCSCTTHQISTIRANRMRRGMTYVCRNCKTQLTLGTVKAVKAPSSKASKAPTSKAEIVRYIIGQYKASNLTLEEALYDIHAIEFVMRKANLNKGLAQTYIKNNW